MGSKNPSSPHFLLNDTLRVPIEQRVSQHLGRRWQVEMVTDQNDRASHAAAILSDGVFGIFAKFGEDSLAQDRFSQEAVGLRLLTERSGVLTPAVVGNINV